MLKKAKRKRKDWKNGTEYTKIMGQLQKVWHTGNGNTRRKREKETEEILETIMTENLPQINGRNKNTEPGSSENTK